MAIQDGQDNSSNDFLYRPSINPPERGFTSPGVPRSVDPTKVLADEIPDPYAAWVPTFEQHARNATILKQRARELLKLSIADIDGYVGDAPPYILAYITDLTGIEFPSRDEDPDAVSPEFTLSNKTKECIYRAAGYFDSQNDYELSEALVNFDTKAIAARMNRDLSGRSYLGKHGILMYGIKLLVIVLKVSYVIAIYYTVGYLCSFFRGKLKIGKRWKVAGKRFGFEFCIGNKISDYLKGVERSLLSVVGYSCRKNPSITPVECPTALTSSDLEKQFSFKQIECCTTKPIFFDNRQFYEQKFSYTACLQAAIDAELDPIGYMNGRICSYENVDNDRTPTPEEQAKAKVVADYLTSKGESRYGLNGYQNIGPLNNAINNADSATIMSRHVTSILGEKSYEYTNFKYGKGAFDCFGYSLKDSTTAEQDIINAINQNAGRWMKESADPPIVIGSPEASNSPAISYLADTLKLLDQGVGGLVDIADRIVIGTANLTLWGSSRQLCCWVYLLVFASTMIRRLIQTHGHLCNDKKVSCYNCGGTGMKNNVTCVVCNGTGEVQDFQVFAENLRHEMGALWATEIKKSAEVQQFVAILKVIKAIIDTYINSLSRPILLQGLRLPLQEMWELIKITIANGLAQFMDALLMPIDTVLSGLQGIPEVRLALANECFGIDRLFDFLVCNLNNLKFSIVNSIMRLIDFTINDLTLINDIYLSRTRLSTLEALSRLLDSLINLILGLKDCYNPSELVDEIVNKQMNEQYNQIRDIDQILSEVGMEFGELTEMRTSLVGNEFPVSEEERGNIDNMPGTISRSFGPLAGVAEDIVVQSLKTFDMIETGAGVRPKTLKEFAQVLETQSGTSIAEVKESLLHIFDILRGA